MQFLNPTILFGLVAAAVPVVLHFLSRRRVVEIPFAPLRFLIPTQEKQMKRMSLRRLLILLLRVAIIACVVLACARPTLQSGPSAFARSKSGVSALILLDDSASMRSQMSSGLVFDQAKREAQEIVRGLGPKDEVAVLRFSDAARPVFAEFIRDRDLVVDELGRLESGSRATDYLASLDGAVEFLRRGTRPLREIYLVGDLQKTDLDSLEVVRWRGRLDGQLPVGVHLRRVEQELFVNRQVIEVERPGALLRARETTELSARISQDAAEDAEVGVFLQIGGTSIAETELTFAAAGVRRHGFPLTLPAAGDLGGSVRLRPDRYPLDDESFFVLTVSEQVPVLILRGVGHEEAERDPLVFLRAALDPDAQGRGRFGMRVDDIDRFDTQSLPSSPVVVLLEPSDMGGSRLAALGDYLRGGGTALLFAGDPRVRAYVAERLLPALGDIDLGEFRGNDDVIERFEIVAPDHPVFFDLEDEAIETLEEVRQRNFFRLSAGAARTILSWAGGGAAVVEEEVGHGRLIVCGFDPSATAGDFVYSPMFLPLVQRIVGYLATSAWGRYDHAFDVGAPIEVEAVPAALERSGAEWRLVGSESEGVRASLDASRQPARLLAPGVETPGLYEFVAEGRAFATVAVNVAREESRREWWSPEDLAASLGAPGLPLRFDALNGPDLARAMQVSREGTPIHMWFLWLAGLLLVAEGLLARRVGSSR